MTDGVEVVSWGSRIMKSFMGVLVGLALFVGAFALLFWNEGRAVRTAQGLEEGQAGVVTISPDKVDAAYENKLVYLTAPATTAIKLTDSAFGIKAPTALRLARQVEMFQWVQQSQTKTEKQIGGSEKKTTTYTYKTQWSSQTIDSSDFKEPQQHVNPTKMKFSSATFDADPVAIGAFILPQDMLQKLPPCTTMPVTAKSLAKLPPALRNSAKIDDGQFYIGADPTMPQVGDLRIRFMTVESGPISLVAQQSGKTFGPYLTKANTDLSMIEAGLVPVDMMFKHAIDNNMILTWILRGAGLVIMSLGLGLVFGPLATVAGVLPILGDILGMGIAIFSVLVSICLSMITIAIAWLAYRPVLGVGLIAAAIALLVMFKMMGHKKPSPST